MFYFQTPIILQEKKTEKKRQRNNKKKVRKINTLFKQ